MRAQRRSVAGSSFSVAFPSDCNKYPERRVGRWLQMISNAGQRLLLTFAVRGVAIATKPPNTLKERMIEGTIKREGRWRGEAPRCSTDVLIVRVNRATGKIKRPGEGVLVILKIVRVQVGYLCKVQYLASFTWPGTLHRGRHSARCRVCKNDSNAPRVI